VFLLWLAGVLWRLFAWWFNVRDGQEATSFGRGFRLRPSRGRLKSCATLAGDWCASSDHHVQIFGRDFRCTSGMLWVPPLMVMGGGANLLPHDFL
jgi:hypothetical protein